MIDWWRLAPDLRARAGGLDLPNPFRRGLAVPLGPAERAIPSAADGIVEHPPAPARAGAADPVTGGWSSDAAAVVRAARAAAASGGGRVRVQGEGPLAEAVRALVAGPEGDDGLGGDAGVSVVVDVDPTSASVAAGLAPLGSEGVLLVAGRVGRVDLDVQIDVHRRGATVAGVPAPQGGAVQDG